MKKEGLFNYSQLLSQVKKRVALAQQRAIYAANEEMYNKELTLPKTSHSSIVQSPTAKLDSYTNNGNYSIVQSPIAKLDKYAKTEKYTITKSAISQLPTYNFELPVKHLPRVTFIFHIPPLYCVIT